MSQPHLQNDEIVTFGIHEHIRSILLLTTNSNIVRVSLNKNTINYESPITLDVTVGSHRFELKVKESVLNIADIPFTIDDELARANLSNTYVRCKACGKIRTLSHYASDTSMKTILYVCEKCNRMVFIFDNMIYASIDYTGHYTR